MDNIKKLYGGIDPGVNGALCLLSKDGDIIFRKSFPLLKNKKLDVFELKKMLTEFIPLCSHVCLEDVHAIFGSSAGATFNFGWCVGLFEGMLSSCNVPYTLVSPKDWQKEMWQGIDVIKNPSKTGKKMVNDTKATSLVAARRLFPNETFLNTEKCSKPHDGIVDAVLMAEYCRRKMK